MHELPRMVADEPIGKEVPVHGLRKGQQQTSRSRSDGSRHRGSRGCRRDRRRRPRPISRRPPPVAAGPLGLTLADLTPKLRTQFGIESEVKGVVVTEVAENSAAAEKRVQAGDVILEISQEPVATPDEVEKRIEQLKSDGRKSALLLLANKDGDLRFVAVTLD